MQVLEETGLEIDDMVCPDDMLEATLDNKCCQLFVVSGLDPESAKFAPQVQKVCVCVWCVCMCVVCVLYVCAANLKGVNSTVHCCFIVHLNL